jgi:GntR family transcriptional repressor for pyruvate dehydrogenase complex
MFKNIKINRISDEIADQIKQILLKGELSPGDKLPTELELSEMFSVSRTAVREALFCLETQGLIERKKSGGTVIKYFSPLKLCESIVFTPKTDLEMFLDFMEARKMLETQIIGSAVARGQPKDFELIEHSLRCLENEIINGSNGVEADIMFHQSLAACTHNQVLITLIKSIGDMLRQNREKTLRFPGRLLECLKEHRSIYAAVKAKNAGQAQQLIQAHLDQVVRIANQIYN